MLEVLRARTVALGFAALLAGCAQSTPEPTLPSREFSEGPCVSESTPLFLQKLGCAADFHRLASVPLDSTLPGARSAKVVLDMQDGNALYFQNSVTYPIHYDFVSKHLSGNGKPLVPSLSLFNTTEYFSPERRFVLGAITYYEGPGLWTFELSPYDTASAEMMAKAFQAVQAAAFFGPGLYFHATSEAVALEAAKLPKTIALVTTDEIYAGTDYQPLTLASAMGRLKFTTVANLTTEYLSYEDIVVLDEAPNDISVVQGLITQEFQTPLSHVNVLSQNRQTPNMGLRGALNNETLRALEGKPVELTVTASQWKVREVTLAEAQAFWAAHRPPPVTLPALNLGVTSLLDVKDITVESSGVKLRDAIKTAVLAFGGKTAQYSVLANTPNLPVQKAFGVPVFYYDQFMRENGFFARIDALLADGSFQSDPRVRDARLAELRAAMLTAPVNAAFQGLLKAKLAADYPGKKIRFRTSTNSEDLEGFPCAGCYESQTGDPADWEDLLTAVRETWSSIWLFRTFEERSYYGIDHKSVGMGLLVHPNFSNEEANGVAVTANPFDPTGLDPALYVNVQFGGSAEVVHPPPGVTTDSFLYYFTQPNQPVVYLSRSNLIAKGASVLTNAQVHELGVALDRIHTRFSPAYGPAAGITGWYAMDVEFKFDDVEVPGQPAKLYVKQARPYPGRGE